MNKLKLNQEIDILLRAIRSEQAAYDNACEKNEPPAIREPMQLRLKQLNDQLDDLYESMEEIEEREPTSGGE